MFGRSGVPGLTCGRGGAHAVRTRRLTVSTTRVSDLASIATLIDDTARYRQGWDAFTVPAPIPGDPVLWHATYMPFIARDRKTGAPVAHVSLYLGEDGGYRVGGTVGPAHRGQGYGREALAMVCLVAHRHLGIADLAAGCESSNVASRRWLASCGFSQVDGPARYTLPNGRVIDSLWWRRSNPAAHRCRNPPPGATVGDPDRRRGQDPRVQPVTDARTPV